MFMLSFARQKSIVTLKQRHFLTILFSLVLSVGTWSQVTAQEQLDSHAAGSWFVYKGSLPDDPETRAGHFGARSFESPKALARYRGDLWFRLTVDRDNLPNIADLAVDLGRVGDADRAYWNGRLVGNTGIQANHVFFLPHLRRVYVIGNVSQQTNTLVVHANKIALDSLGIGLDPTSVRFGSSAELTMAASRDYVARTILPFVVGIVLLLFGMYHLFLYGFLRSFPDYRDLGICLIFFGVFAVCASFLPYEMGIRPEHVMRAHALGSIWAFVFFGRYVLGQSRARFRWFHKVHYILAAGFSVAVLTATQLETVMERYVYWYLLLIPALLGTYVLALLNQANTRTRTLGLVVTLTALVVALFHDVLVTLAFVEGDLWGIAVVLFVLAGSILVIGRDFAHAHLAVEHTVTLRTQDLQRANEELRSLEKMKARFFANISHDFKTPIAIAFGHIEEAKHSAIETAKQALTSAEKALNSLQGMVGDILDMVKGESGTFQLKWETVSIAKILKAWAAPYEVLCRKKGLTLQYAIAVNDSLSVPIDISKIERVFANLMLNALKFTDEGSVTVGVRTDDSRIYLEVTDTGPGILEKERERIFDRYYQGFDTSLRDHGGSGIGLSFVKEVVSAHNGQVWVEPVPEGGSRFVVSLPLSQDVEITGTYIVTDSDVRAMPLKGSLDVPYPESSPLNHRPDSPSLLLVEDNPEVAQVIVNAMHGYNIYFAKDGIEGLEHLAKRNIHCILSDIMMPRMDGKEFLIEVKKNDRWKVIPFICLTSMSETEHMVECLNLGANNYVTKPFHQEVLRSTVATLIENSLFRDQLVAKEKMASLGLLSAGLAHEIRNPVHSAKNLMEGLRREFERLGGIDFSSPEQALKELETIARKSELVQAAFVDAQNCVSRIHNITEAIGSYSTGSSKLDDLDLVAAVRQELSMVEGKRKEKAVTIFFPNDQPIIVQAFPSIHQAILNVIDNAIDVASAGGGQVHIKVIETKDEAHIHVTDNGVGIPLDQQPYIFDAFYTAKPDRRGTGLGLYITRAIIEYQHLGTIGLHSEEGQGSTFIINLKKVPDLKNRSTLSFKGFPVPI